MTDGHLCRRAVIYIRQSSEAQVRTNTGSTEVQRDAVGLAYEWGWSQELVEPRDEDLGASASEPSSREGFNRLIQEMLAGQIGAVFVVDSSRLGRNEVDHALFANAARLGDVLLVVGVQVFDFKDPDSAFMAGVLGHFAVRENRSRAKFGGQSKRKKAMEGRAPTAPPVGFVRSAGGGWDLDPDDRVQEVIRIVFSKFFEIRSAMGVLRYLRQNGIQLPRRPRRGGKRWADATPNGVFAILRNVAYAGTYVYGRTGTDYTRGPFKSGQRRQRQLPADKWIVIENHHPGYIEPYRLAEIRKILAQNRLTISSQPVGRGEALLQGVLICAKHRVKLNTVYTARERLADGSVRRGARYWCAPNRQAGKHETCCTIRSGRLDAAIEAELFRTLAPPSLEAIRTAAHEALRQHGALVRAREDELRRAERASAQLEEEFLSTNASQRAIKERLAELWDQARRHHADLVQRRHLEPLVQPLELDGADFDELQQLLGDLASLWRHPNVTPQQRKTIVRLVFKAIYVTSGPEVWTLEVEWVGGSRSRSDVLTRKGVGLVIEREHMSGRSEEEIRQHLAGLGAVRGVGIYGAEAHDTKAVSRVVFRVRRKHAFGRRARLHIHGRVREGASYQVISDELNALGIPHTHGLWTLKRVQRTTYTLRKASIDGLEPLPMPVRLADHVAALNDRGLDASQILEALRDAGTLTNARRPLTEATVREALMRLGRLPVVPRRPAGSTPRDAILKRLWAETPSVAETTRRANEQGLLTNHGKPWRGSGMARKLATLGLRVRKKLGPYEWKRRKKGAAEDV